MAQEHWLPVPGYEGLYDASDLGQVRSHWRAGRILRQYPLKSAGGAMHVTLCQGGKPRLWPVAKIVLMAFRKPHPPGAQALHGPGGITDDSLANLFWGRRRPYQKCTARQAPSLLPAP